MRNKIISTHGMRLTVVLLTLALRTLQAQTITPHVINSAGSHRQAGNTGVWITDNVGEVFARTATSGSVLITEGFIQPEIISQGGFTVVAPFQGPSCQERSDDAFIKVMVSSPASNYTTRYYWTPSSVCPANNCAEVKGIKPGNYSVKVVVSYFNNLGLPTSDTLKTENFIIPQATAPCNIYIFNAITPNSDGVNDTWVIENITDYPKNKVSIYNRWGNPVAEYRGYGTGSNIWPTKAQLDFLQSTTYFYVIELEEGGTPIKGWVELIKNQ